MDDKKPGVKGTFRSETDIIQNIFAPLAKGYEGACGLVDDAAFLKSALDEDFILTADMLVAGVHFLNDASPADVAYKALAVNISDLVSKGAEPEIYLLTIALHGIPEQDWLHVFAEGLAQAQADFSCVLAGGDTVSTPGPLTVSITAAGCVPSGKMVMRSGARPGDKVYVTGAIGDAVAGLSILKDHNGAAERAIGTEQAEALALSYWRPKPKPSLAGVLRSHVSGAMDISDGLAGDFIKLCAASECAGTIEAGRVPFSQPVLNLLKAGLVEREDLLTGGDDYVVLATVPEEKRVSFERGVADSGAQATLIGDISRGAGAQLIGSDGVPMQISRPGYDHF